MAELTCPFCGHDPFHYVDNGVGMEAVAVTCCGFGVELFDHREAASDTVTMSRDEFRRIADIFAAMRTLGLDPNIYGS